MKLEIITTIIRIVIVFLTGFVVPAVRKWLTARTKDEAMNTVKQWAYTVVWAAEQIHNKAKKDDPTGTLRKKYAHEAIERMGLKLGLVLSNDEIEAMIECAVHELNGCRIPAVNEIAAPEEGESHES